MTESDDDILVREFAKASDLGGVLSWLNVGARLVAKLLPTETYTETLALNIAPEHALKLGRSVLAILGKLQTNEDAKPPSPMLKAVVMSGFLNMNPAIVRLEIAQGDPAGCELTVTAVAKESLIKQHAASKAVARVVSGLREIAAQT